MHTPLSCSFAHSQPLSQRQCSVIVPKTDRCAQARCTCRPTAAGLLAARHSSRSSRTISPGPRRPPNTHVDYLPGPGSSPRPSPIRRARLQIHLRARILTCRPGHSSSSLTASSCRASPGSEPDQAIMRCARKPSATTTRTLDRTGLAGVHLRRIRCHRRRREPASQSLPYGTGGF
jgi:hypothetical protein